MSARSLVISCSACASSDFACASRLLLLAQIELDDHIAFLDGRTGTRDVQNLKRTADRRRHQANRADRPQLARRVDDHGNVPLHDTGCRDDGAIGLHALHRHDPQGNNCERRAEHASDATNQDVYDLTSS